MTVDTVFELPFPSLISPDAERAQAHSLAWMRERGVLSDAAVDYFAAMRVGEATARWWPHARGEDLDLMADLNSWYSFYDDLVDSTDGARIEQAREMCTNLVAQVDGAVMDGEPDVVTRAWVDLWHRLSTGMSPAWRTRNAGYWRANFISKITELDRQPFADLDAYAAHRHQAAAMQLCIGAGERAYRQEVNDRIVNAPLIQELLSESIFVAHVVSDTFSVAREQARGEVRNAVTVLQRIHGCSLNQAVALTRHAITEHAARFVELEAALPAWADANFTEQERTAAESWVDNMRTIMRGALEYSKDTARYSQEGATMAVRAGYEDGKLRV